MSQQDGGNYSVRRPRETLGAVSHNVSAIPMPASAMKRSTSNSNLQQQAPHTTNHVRSQSGSRMSLAPGRPAQPNFQRSSSGDNLAQMGFSTVQRNSTANFLTSTVGRKSFAPGMSTPANPLQLQESTQRRSSVYSYNKRGSSGFGPVGHQSFFATAPPQNGNPQDPRKLKAMQSHIVNELLEFLSQRNFEMEMKQPLSAKTLTNPIQKDFERMFQFLYRCIDPSYRFQKRIDEEGPFILKQLRYPFQAVFSKTQWTAAGANAWPNFLGLLHWMMQLAKMMELYATGEYDHACIEAGYDISADRITFNFLSNAYKEWLSIEDDDDEEEEAKRRIEPHVQAMAAEFEKANESNLEQIKVLEAESKALQEQIDELSKSAPKLAELDETIKLLEDDKDKFEQYNQKLQQKAEKYTNRAEVLQQEIEKVEQELREAEEERNDLQKKVDDQGLSTAVIDRMNADRERLQENSEAASTKLEDAKDRMSKKETETGDRLDELESAVQNYNRLGYTISVIPSNAHNARGYEHELRLNVNAGPNFSTSQLGASSQQVMEADRLLYDQSHGYQIHHLLQTDLKANKKELQSLRTLISERRSAAWEEDMAKLDLLEKASEALDDKASDINTLDYNLRTAREEFEKTKEVTTAQTMASDAYIEKMEKELSRMRAELSDGVHIVEQQEMQVNLEYDDLQNRSNDLREQLHTELERMLTDIIKFKVHIQKSLENHEDFVAGEVEKEVEEQEEAAAAAAAGAGAVVDDRRGHEMEE